MGKPTHTDVSVVIPFLDEEESLPELYQQLTDVLASTKWSYELIFVDDGSQDEGWEFVHAISKKDASVRAVKFTRNFGKSQALHVGFELAKGDVVFTMDADLQDSPNELPALYKMLTKEDLDVVSGWKKVRHDPLFGKTIPSKFFNWTARQFSGIRLHDFNCGLKAYKKEVVKAIQVHGEMHRYIPLLAKHAGYRAIGEHIVQHSARKHGKTKFGPDRFVKGFLDLITLLFIQRFGKRPMHFFGLIGSLMLVTGFGFALYLGIDKLYLETEGRLITERPEFYLALTTMILGSQFFLAGFLAELFMRSRNKSPNYRIRETL
ncbi:MAG: glycosyltransferase family 2 protein [Flavobacteriaceae bacterium]|nr:glycosyltransferase family 2 protein [Flavobacteriaceae bacterium]